MIRAAGSTQTLGDSRKVSQASSQDSDSNALQSQTGGRGQYQPAQLVPSALGPNEVEGSPRQKPPSPKRLPFRHKTNLPREISGYKRLGQIFSAGDDVRPDRRI